MDKKELEEYFYNKELLYYFDKQIPELTIVKEIGNEAINLLNELKSCYTDTFEEILLSQFIGTTIEAIAFNNPFIKSESNKLRNMAVLNAISILKYDERDEDGLTCDSDEFNQIFEVAEKYIRLSIFT